MFEYLENMIFIFQIYHSTKTKMLSDLRDVTNNHRLGSKVIEAKVISALSTVRDAPTCT